MSDLGKLAAAFHPRPLIQKLAEVMGAVGYIAKSGTNEAQGYKYARESDIVQAIRGELSARSVMVIPDVLEVNNYERTRADGKPGATLTRVKVCWHLIDGESGDELTVCAFGDGMDSGDKGYYKAMTGCQKYLWMKMLHLPTGDDPEADRPKRGAPIQREETSQADVAKRFMWEMMRKALKSQYVLDALKLDKDTAAAALEPKSAAGQFARTTVMSLCLKVPPSSPPTADELSRVGGILADLFAAAEGQ